MHLRRLAGEEGRPVRSGLADVELDVTLELPGHGELLVGGGGTGRTVQRDRRTGFHEWEPLRQEPRMAR